MCVLTQLLLAVVMSRLFNDSEAVAAAYLEVRSDDIETTW